MVVTQSGPILPGPRPDYSAWCKSVAMSIAPQSVSWLPECLRIVRELGFTTENDAPTVTAAVQGAVFHFLSKLKDTTPATRDAEGASARCRTPLSDEDRSPLESLFFIVLVSNIRTEEVRAALERACKKLGEQDPEVAREGESMTVPMYLKYFKPLNNHLREMLQRSPLAAGWDLASTRRDFPRFTDPDVFLYWLAMTLIERRSSART